MDGMSSMVMGESVSSHSSEFLIAIFMSILGPSLDSLYVRERSMFGCDADGERLSRVSKGERRCCDLLHARL
jgi:hypothetical protein